VANDPDANGDSFTAVEDKAIWAGRMPSRFYGWSVTWPYLTTSCSVCCDHRDPTTCLMPAGVALPTSKRQWLLSCGQNHDLATAVACAAVAVVSAPLLCYTGRTGRGFGGRAQTEVT
jgi:hypothetical protein